MGTNIVRFTKRLGIALATVMALALVAPAANVAGRLLIGPTKAFAYTEYSADTNAYAVLDSSGTLTFIRSPETVVYSPSMTITDCEGNSYTGTVWSGLESSLYAYNY